MLPAEIAVLASNSCWVSLHRGCSISSRGLLCAGCRGSSSFGAGRATFRALPPAHDDTNLEHAGYCQGQGMCSNSTPVEVLIVCSLTCDAPR